MWFRKTAIGTAALSAAILTTVQSRSAPSIGHVFILVLENESFERTFGPQSRAAYLSKSLPADGALLTQYYGIGHQSLDNYVAMVSGQAPNRATQMDCTRYTEFRATQATLDANGQALGTGCVYPASVRMIGDELEAAAVTWKAYMEDLGNDPKKESASCGHPAIGARDNTMRREPRDQYATKHNPFYYFHSLIDDRGRCASHVVNLDQLATDLTTEATTPSYVFITPNLCDDGHDAPCVDGAPGGLVQADAFLRRWVPRITGSAAFKHDGVLIITFDETSGDLRQGSLSCCGERRLPGQILPPGLDGPGGGRVGAVILSPFVRAGTVSSVPYNHYALLRWVEDVFGVPHLGYAGASGLVTFGNDIFDGTLANGGTRVH